jgi:hypothetical protein
MIINLYAILSILVVVILGLGLNVLVPRLFAGPYHNFVISLLVTFVGSLAELFGIRARIFLMPMWLLGLGMVGYHAFVFWGVLGILPPVVAMGLGLWWMVKVTEAREAERWARAAVSLSDLRSFADGADTPAFWRLVEHSVVLPITGTYSPEVCAHNLEVTRIVLDQTAKSSTATQPDLAVWSSFETFLKENEKREKPQHLDFDLKGKLEEFIQARTKGRAAA